MLYATPPAQLDRCQHRDLVSLQSLWAMFTGDHILFLELLFLVRKNRLHAIPLGLLSTAYNGPPTTIHEEG